MSAERWYPDFADYGRGRPQAGDLLPADRQVWRILEVRDVPEIDREPTDEQGCFYVTFQNVKGGKRRHQKWQASMHWQVYRSDHYPVCSECGEPWPCLHLDAAQAASSAAKRLDHLTSILPGCCWSCGEPITHRQESVEYDGDNVWLPTAPRARFHRRRKCVGSAYSYEKQWLAADPAREPILRVQRGLVEL